MEIDKTTLRDLGIFTSGDYPSVSEKLNLASTLRGQQQLIKNLQTTYTTTGKIKEVQNAIAYIASISEQWPKEITNGTLMVVEKYFDSRVDPIPAKPGAPAAFIYKISNLHDFTLVKYSVQHLYDFLLGFKKIVQICKAKQLPVLIEQVITEADKYLTNTEIDRILIFKKTEEITNTARLRFGAFILNRYKYNILSLVQLYGTLDAWLGMAGAMKKYGLVFPNVIDHTTPEIKAEKLFHLQLANPIAYDLKMDEQRNFMFLTGANMAGKSTFIKTLGVAAYLAHTGMGVPAASMSISLLHGLLTNINVADNITKGESFFYNEVQRIKSTVLKVNDNKNWLILIDELFKGTNVEDAMKCSTAVIEGLIKRQNALFVLSTHLYEIGDGLQQHNNIIFKYFETQLSEGKLHFSYALKPGISTDRLGYFILESEGVVEMLKDL